MARISPWKNYKSKDYYFLDRVVKEQFEIGGTGIYIHKYIGPVTADGETDPDQLNELKIQDLVLMENRDRKYDPDIYELRGTYQLSDHDFDLSQFGLFLSSDTVYISFHMNDMVERMGRRLMSGDVLELVHARDELGLDDTKSPSRKFYVVQDAAKSAEGYSITWRPHIWRVKCTPLEDSQEYKQIINQIDDNGESLRTQQSSFDALIKATDAVVAIAQENVPSTDPYVNHLAGLGDPVPAVDYGAEIPSGMNFPSQANQGDKFIRTDFMPSRLFEYRDRRWHRLVDSTSNSSWHDRTVNGATFVNNQAITAANGTEFAERQALSKVIKPKKDNN